MSFPGQRLLNESVANPVGRSEFPKEGIDVASYMAS